MDWRIFYLAEEVRKRGQYPELPTKTRINREEVGSPSCNVCAISGQKV